MVLSDHSNVRTAGIIRGESTTGGIPISSGGTPIAGSVGVFLRSNSQLLVANGVEPTIQGDNGTNGGAGTGADVRINNPAGGTTDLAVRAGQGTPAGTFAYPFTSMAITAAGAVVFDAQQLKTWANWKGAAATQFNRHAFNPHDGSYVTDAPTP